MRKRILQESLDALNQKGQNLLNSGQIDRAFVIWYRELRLSQYLGDSAQIKILGQIGKVAWDNSRTDDIKTINNKLLSIQEQLETTHQMNLANLNLLLAAYQSVHSLDNIILVQQRILALTDKNSLKEEEALEGQGQAYLARFDYTNAAKVYEILLKKVQARSDTVKEEQYLKILSKIYQENSDPKNSIAQKKKLISTYEKSKQLDLVAGLLISIGNEYQVLNDYQKANEYYQKAFNLAWSLQYLGYAEESMNDLANLYYKSGKIGFTLAAYYQLLAVQKKSYNYYGLMQTYNKMGDIYLSQKDYRLALESYQNALQLGKSISYEINYLQKKINALPKSKN
jgi:tetratricopeptide (TPR) repeat protein